MTAAPGPLKRISPLPMARPGRRSSVGRGADSEASKAFVPAVI